MTTICPTFITSPAVTAEVLHIQSVVQDSPLLTCTQTVCWLNNTYRKGKHNYKPNFKNFFNPVKHDLTTMLEPSGTDVKFVIDVFDNSVEELRQKLKPVGKQIQKQCSASSVAFAVLDEQSAKDQTVVIWYDHPSGEDENEAATGFELLHWRVQFVDAHELVGQLENGGMELIEVGIIEQTEAHTDKNGVFHLEDALRDAGAGLSE